MRPKLERVAHLVLWILVASSLYEGYLVLPGMHGHSIFSVLAKLLVIPLPLAAAWFWYRHRPPGAPVVILFTLWVVWVLVSFVVHPFHGYVEQYYTWTQVGGWLILLALWLLARHPAWIAAVWSIGFPLYWAATLAVGIWEVHTGHHLGASSVHGKRTPTAFFFDPNNLGAALAIMLPFMWFLPYVWKGRAGQVGAAVLTLLSLWLLVKTGSRGGEVALVLDLAALPFVLPAKARTWALAALGAVVVAGVGLVAWARHLGPTAKLPLALSKLARIPDLFTMQFHTHLPPNVAPGSVTIRYALYRSGVWALSLHPFGLGPRGAERWYTYWVHHGSPYNTYGIVDAHNLWLELAMNYGWIGLLLFVAAYVLLIRYAYRAGRGSRGLKKGLGQAAFCALIGFVVGSLSPSSVMIGFNVMWVVMGLALAAGRLPET